MIQSSLSNLLHVPIRLEVHGREILLFGFFLLLLLICFTGYWGQKSLQEVESKTAEMRETDARHLRIALHIGEVAGEMAPEVRAVIVNKGYDTLLYLPALHQLQSLKGEMDAALDDGRKTSLSSIAEFQDVEQSFNEFWVAVTSEEPPAQGWDAKRDRFSASIHRLGDYTRKEREMTEEQGAEMTKRSRVKIGLATGGVLIVGLVVIALTFSEIDRVLKRLGRAYEESAESRDYLQSLLDSLVSGVVVIASDGSVTITNQTFLESAGLTGGIAKASDYHELFTSMPALADVISERLDTATTNHGYCGRVERDGGRLFDVYASPLLISGEKRGVILVFVDITEVELAQMELLRNRTLSAVGQMTAQVAHEIRNPLGSINLALALLKRRSAIQTEEEREVISVIGRSMEHLGAIVTELLEFSRPKELNRAEVNLNSILDSILPMVADRSKAKDVTIERDYDVDLPSANYDEAELRKLFINLIINAIDASETGGRVELRTRRDGPGNLIVEVTDNGCGMDGDTIRRLYEPFFTTKTKGTGLGMSIARKITELHRGDLKVRSRKGSGTTMTVRLPLEYSEAERQPVGQSTASQ
jgi:PAS domain S-box-containing protein